MTAIGTTHGKIILIGEHSVVYGQPAITIPLLDIPTIVHVRPGENDSTYLTSNYFCGPLTESPDDLRGIQLLIELLSRDLPITTPLDIDITSELPIERGMGSSAATGAAITKAMFAYAKVTLTQEKLLQYTNFSEKIIHGTPSGVDAITVNSQQPIYFIKGKITQPFSMNLDAYLIVIDSGIKGQTGEAVHDLRILKKSHPQQITQKIKKLGQLTKQAKQVIEQKDVWQLGNIFQTAQLILQSLQISNPTLDRLVTKANQAGALGTKITGGGRGGCLIALAENKTSAQNIMQALKNEAHHLWLQPLNNFR